ncbi:MAG TPA: geranylgeranylglycerol-phosphate geranylgeranyltransferase [Chitinophagaceae bacterium]|nr:geranylgeranylglycerol-phosphate geranylgeranyltransferase [Chitinophagaceae bacterium]
MKLILAFLTLIRSLNLFFIVLTQALFYYCIFPFAFDVENITVPYTLTPKYFWLLSAASVLIAAAGYIINDYFDLNIDQVNKPDKLVVDRIIKRRWTIIWHWVFSFAGVALSFYIGWKISDWIIGLANAGCVLLLLLYSTTFKKKLLIGNLIISLLTAWVVMVLFVAEWRPYTINLPDHRLVMSRLFKLAVVYAGFAFIISLVREVVKDIEDMEGDARYNCKTMPIVWGVNVCKMFAGVWLVVLMLSILVLQVYVLQFKWWASILYSVVFIVAPLAWILVRLYRANSRAEFHSLSNAIKFVMLTGILSMLFFKLYS